MVSKVGRLWQKIQHHPFIVIGIIVLLITFLAFVLAVHWWGWDWTGFNGGYGKITTHTPAKDTKLPPAKTLWDWMQLLAALAIPVVVGFGVAWFTRSQQLRDQQLAAQRDKTEHEIAADNQREAALQAYLDKMSELLLHEKLRDSAEEDEVRTVAHVRTLTVLRRLDASRKASVIQFLHESRLIDKDNCIISLSWADLGVVNLSWADLSRADLRGINLRGTNLFSATLREATLREATLSRADLREATLREVDLSNADLSRANLSGADLSGATLSGAKVTEEQLKTAKSLKDATMPDGSKHP